MKVKMYEGKEPYIFISYAHKDTNKVMPIVERLDKDGYRVWYDEGIAPIETWDDFIAGKVKKCEIMLAFISNNYINSSNCMDELNYARSKNKKILRVHIEKNVVLPDGAEMRLERIQAVFRTDYKNENDFFEKLYLAKDISMCLKVKKNLEMNTSSQKLSIPLHDTDNSPVSINKVENNSGEIKKIDNQIKPSEIIEKDSKNKGQVSNKRKNRFTEFWTSDEFSRFVNILSLILMAISDLIIIFFRISGKFSDDERQIIFLMLFAISAFPFFIFWIGISIINTKEQEGRFVWKVFWENMSTFWIYLVLSGFLVGIVYGVITWIMGI